MPFSFIFFIKHKVLKEISAKAYKNRKSRCFFRRICFLPPLLQRQSGCPKRIRTLTNRVRVCRATITQSGNFFVLSLRTFIIIPCYFEKSTLFLKIFQTFSKFAFPGPFMQTHPLPDPLFQEICCKLSKMVV